MQLCHQLVTGKELKEGFMIFVQVKQRKGERRGELLFPMGEPEATGAYSKLRSEGSVKRFTEVKLWDRQKHVC